MTCRGGAGGDIEETGQNAGQRSRLAGQRVGHAPEAGRAGEIGRGVEGYTGRLRLQPANDMRQKRSRTERQERLCGQIGRAHAELQSLMRISYAVFCLKKKTKNTTT